MTMVGERMSAERKETHGGCQQGKMPDQAKAGPGMEKQEASPGSDGDTYCWHGERETSQTASGCCWHPRRPSRRTSVSRGSTNLECRSQRTWLCCRERHEDAIQGAMTDHQHRETSCVSAFGEVACLEADEKKRGGERKKEENIPPPSGGFVKATPYQGYR